MEQLKGSQRKYLRSQAHHLKPLVIIGGSGINKQVIGSVDLALKDHELIKVKFGEFKEAKKEISRKSRKPQKTRLCESSATSLSSTTNIPSRKKEKSKYRKATIH